MSAPTAPQIEFLESVDSTNSYLVSRAGSLTPFHTVATEDQTAGRGRLGRSWECSRGSGVAMSIALPLFPGSPKAGIYPLIVGSAVLDFVRKEGLIGAEMKWPNDIHVKGSKIAGILCEMAPTGFVIAGVGLNLSHTEAQLPHESATSFALEGVPVSEIGTFVGRLVDTMRKVWSAAANNRASWASYLSASLGTIGQRVEVVETLTKSWGGTAVGIDDEGHLIVRSFDDDSLRTVVAADVFHLRQ